MLYHKILPKMCGEFVRWLNDEEFIVLVKGKELIGHKDYWIGEFKEENSKMKHAYKVPVVWSAMGYVTVEADNPDAAKQYVKEHLDEFHLPRDGEYLDDSFEVDEEGEAIYVS